MKSARRQGAAPRAGRAAARARAARGGRRWAPIPSRWWSGTRRRRWRPPSPAAAWPSCARIRRWAPATPCCARASAFAGASRAHAAGAERRPAAAARGDAGRGCSRPTARAGAAATLLTAVLDDPAAYGRVAARRRRPGARDRGGPRRQRRGAGGARDQRRDLRLRGARRCSRCSARCSPRTPRASTT